MREKPGGIGPVSDADLEVDRLLRAELLAARPGYGWLSEESEDGAGAARRRSGSSSSTRSTAPAPSSPAQPAWALSLAVVEAGRVVAGVVHLPALGQHLRRRARRRARG